MDAFGHVNHAKMVTLLEEARVPLLFAEAGFAKGMVVVELKVSYRAPVVVNGGPVRIEISLRDLKFASVTLGYSVHNGPSHEDEVAATAETVLAAYELETERPRRLTDDERAFLRTRLGGGDD